jgi:hypothetical protein
MQKTAQKRSILNKLREMSNVSGIAAEKFFNPQFQKVMESLRAKDDQIRSIVSGVAIGDGDPGPDPVSLKDLIKSAKSNLNRREYMSAISDLGRFHKKIFDVSQEIKTLSLDIDSVHHEFLFKDLGDEQKKHLQDLKTRFANDQKNSIIKEASIMDFFYNIGTKRGRALAAWEKRYPKQVGKLKKDTFDLLKNSEKVLSEILSSLKEMASARSTRNVDVYVKFCKKITDKYESYDSLFKSYYTDNVKGFLEKVELVAPTAKVENSKELGKQEVPVEGPKPPNGPSSGPDTIRDVPSLMAPDPSIPIPLVVQKSPTSVSPTGPTMLSLDQPLPPPPAIPTEPATAPSTIPSPPPSMSETIPSPPPTMTQPPESGFKSDDLAKQMWGKSAHEKFFDSLKTLSNEEPIILKSYIAKYAKSIQLIDPTVSIQLFNIAKNIKG